MIWIGVAVVVAYLLFVKSGNAGAIPPAPGASGSGVG